MIILKTRRHATRQTLEKNKTWRRHYAYRILANIIVWEKGGQLVGRRVRRCRSGWQRIFVWLLVNDFEWMKSSHSLQDISHSEIKIAFVPWPLTWFNLQRRFINLLHFRWSRKRPSIRLRHKSPWLNSSRLPSRGFATKCLPNCQCQRQMCAVSSVYNFDTENLKQSLLEFYFWSEIG